VFFINFDREGLIRKIPIMVQATAIQKKIRVRVSSRKEKEKPSNDTLIARIT
jgi:hypothetical protein